ncbi:MAG: putative glycolipid-binding domain-containing protein [Thermoplasmataceae archaeon]
MANRDIFWKGINPRGLEHLALNWNDSILADGLLISSFPDNTGDYFSLQYYLQADKMLNIQEWKIQCFEHGNTFQLYLKFDNDQWTGHLNGTALSNLPSTKYVDLSYTPFTNTFPIRELMTSEKTDISVEVLYIEIPNLNVRSLRQKYTKISGIEFQYSAVGSNKTYNIETDSFGIVTKYDGIWEQA